MAPEVKIQAGLYSSNVRQRSNRSARTRSLRSARCVQQRNEPLDAGATFIFYRLMTGVASPMIKVQLGLAEHAAAICA
jgi:hypothetical protein